MKKQLTRIASWMLLATMGQAGAFAQNIRIDMNQTYPEKTIWCYSGFTYDKELLGEGYAHCECTVEMLQQIDVLVDGRFVEALKNLNLRFRGSSNQRIIDVPASLRTGEVVLWEETK